MWSTGRWGVTIGFFCCSSDFVGYVYHLCYHWPISLFLQVLSNPCGNPASDTHAIHFTQSKKCLMYNIKSNSYVFIVHATVNPCSANLMGGLHIEVAMQSDTYIMLPRLRNVVWAFKILINCLSFMTVDAHILLRISRINIIDDNAIKISSMSDVEETRYSNWVQDAMWWAWVVKGEWREDDDVFYAISACYHDRHFIT